MKYYGLDWLGAGPVGKSNFLSLNKALKNIYIYRLNLTRLDDSRTVYRQFDQQGWDTRHQQYVREKLEVDSLPAPRNH